MENVLFKNIYLLVFLFSCILLIWNIYCSHIGLSGIIKILIKVVNYKIGVKGK